MLIRHDRPEDTFLVQRDDWPFVATFFDGRGAGVAIAPRWVLTAAHVAATVPIGHRIMVGDRRHQVTAVHHHPVRGGERPGVGVDLALVSTGQPMPPPFARLATDPVPPAEELTIVGGGETGDGLRGVTRRADGVLRRCTSKTTTVRNGLLVLTFAAPPDATIYEGASGIGDSGGPALRQVDDGWEVCAVNSFQFTLDRGRYGARSFYQVIWPHIDWIVEVTQRDAP